MTLQIAIPSGIESQLRIEWGADFERRALEALAIEGYRTGALSAGQVAEMLGLARCEADGFLKEHGVESLLTFEDIERGSQALNATLAR